MTTVLLGSVTLVVPRDEIARAAAALFSQSV
jgi:hypothetical protein